LLFRAKVVETVVEKEDDGMIVHDWVPSSGPFHLLPARLRMNSVGERYREHWHWRWEFERGSRGVIIAHSARLVLIATKAATITKANSINSQFIENKPIYFIKYCFCRAQGALLS